MFIDIHAHLNDERLISDVENVILRAKEQGVGKIVCAGSDYNSSKIAVELANKNKNVYATVGLHPQNCIEFDKKMEKFIIDSAKNQKVVAVGEIGLDFYDLEYQIREEKKRNPNFEGISYEELREKQKEIFIKQIKLANKVGLPIMIHMRDATEQTIRILEENKNLLEKGGLLHCYSGSLETTKKIFDLGFYVSIGGSITFKNARVMPEVLKEVGIERVCLETDCPYLSPEPFRGRTNEPKNIPLIAEKIAQITNKNIKDVEDVTTENCYKVFPRLKNDWYKKLRV